MADKIVVEAEVKSNIGDVSKDASGLASEFKIMGVSLNSVKAGFKSAAVAAKASFATMRAGLISTGIGAFVVLIGSLVSYFTNTKRGADTLKRAMTGLGAVVSVITDLFSRVGETMVNAFKNPQQTIKDLWKALKKNIVNRITGVVDQFKALGKVIKSALSLDWDGVTEGAGEFGTALIQVGTGMDEIQQKNFANTLKGITTEIKKEAAAMMALEKRTQNLRDADNKFMVQKAKTRQEIEKARLNAEDETKSAEERLEALKTALSLEEKTTQRELELAAERLAIQKEEMALSENSAEDEERLAQLKVELIEKETASVKMRRRVVTEVNALEREILAEEKARAKEKQDIIDAEAKRLEDSAKRLEDSAKKKADDDKKRRDAEAAAEAAAAEESIRLAEEVAAKKKAVQEEMISNFISTINSSLEAQGNRIEAEYNREIELAEASGKDTEAIEEKFEAKRVALAEKQKKVKIGLATVSMYQSVVAAYNAGSELPGVGVVMGPVSAAAALAAGLANINAIMQTDVGGGGGGGSVSAADQPPAPQMMSGAFDISGGIAPEASKSYVVTDEMSNSQNQLANIRRRATI